MPFLDEKVLVVASPRLRQSYVEIYPKNVRGVEDFASTIKVAFTHGKLLDVQELPKPDLIIEGSVAVDLHSNSLAKEKGLVTKKSKTSEDPSERLLS